MRLSRLHTIFDCKRYHHGAQMAKAAATYNADFTGRTNNSRRGRVWQKRTRERIPGRDWANDQRDQDAVRRPGLKDSWIGDVVYGVSPVLAAMEAGRRTIHALYLQQGAEASRHRKDKTAVVEAMQRAEEMGIQVINASKHDLNMVCDNRPHQGMVLDASFIDFEPLESMPWTQELWGGDIDERAQPPVWLCLDEVVDPQNFGAALRSALFLGASGILTCKRNSSPLTGVVSKASSGAMELMPVHSCKSLPATLAEARNRGWTVVGAAAIADAVDCYSYQPSGPVILVMGNEGYGLRTTVTQQCDVMLRITSGDMSSHPVLAQGLGGAVRAKAAQKLVDSLNVSVATGILLHQLLNPRNASMGIA